MIIAKIVKSNSHIDYVGRVVDSLDSEDPPTSDDYGFAQFVSLPQEDVGEEIIGVIYNSMLINPEFASYGPRLSPKPELGNFSPDYLNEQGFLIGILLLGALDKDEKVTHGVPRRVVPPGQTVFGVSVDDVRKFHTDKDGTLQIHYFSQVIAHAGLFAVQLLESIIEQLITDSSPEDQKRLSVLKQTLAWQRAFSGMRL